MFKKGPDGSLATLHHPGLGVHACQEEHGLAGTMACLRGGLYCVSLGGCFFDESMVSHQSDASKAALVALSERLLEWGFDLIDCQMMNPHLERLGAKAMPRAAFLDLLKKSLRCPTRRESWDES